MKIYRPSRRNIANLTLVQRDIANLTQPLRPNPSLAKINDEKIYSAGGFIKGIQQLDSLVSLNYGFSTQKFGNMAFKYGGAEEVVYNRRNFLASAGIELRDVVFMRPNHGTKIEVVTGADKGKGAVEPGSGVGPADALITFEKGTGLGLNSADCIPLIVASKSSDVLALIHAGRRGTDARITAKVIKKLSGMGVNVKDLIVGIGPSVQKSCYKLENLKTSNPTMWLPWITPQQKQTQILIEENQAEGFFNIRAEKGKIIVDILGYNIQQLIETGIDPDNIDVAPVCSTCFAKKRELYSHSLANLYKKSNLYPEGRFMAVAMLK